MGVINTIGNLVSNGGRSAAWNPSALSPTAWWRNGIANMPSDGSSWIDVISGQNFAPLGSNPTFVANARGTKPAYSFNGTTQQMSRTKLSQIENQSGLTIWAVGMGMGIQQKGSSMWTGLLDNANIIYCLPNSNAGYGQVTSTHLQDNYCVMVFNGALSGNANRLKLYRNGAQQTLSFTGTVPASLSSDATTVLKLADFNGGKMPGRAFDYGIVNRAISATELSFLNSYLAKEFAITGETYNVYWYGDSFTFGAGVSDTQRFSKLVSAARGWNEVNNGISGTPLQNAVPVQTNNLYSIRNSMPVKDVNDKYVIISHGVNDRNLGLSNPATYNLTNYNSQYQAIIDVLRTKGWTNDIILQMGWYVTNTTNWQDYIDATQAIATTNGLLFIDQAGQMNAGDLQVDNIHPNASGHTKIANHILSLI